MNKLSLNQSRFSDDLHIPTRYTYHLLMATFLALFVLIFCLIYNPSNIENTINSWGVLSYFFHILMISCITFASSLLCRLVLWALQTKYDFPTWKYILFCFCEMTVIASFVALYVSLFSHQNYLEILPDCEVFSSLVLVYPYVFSIILRVSSNRLSALSENKEDPVNLAKFYDEGKKIKLAVDPNSLLYIASDGNYVNIHYVENNQIKVFLLRNSMKQVGEVALNCGLVRCHRSFFINPNQIKALSRNRDNNITAELKVEGESLIPISKMYYEAIVEKL